MSHLAFALAGMLVILGFILMSGEGSDSSAFRPEIFSAMRIRVAPMLCLAGYILVAVGIMSHGTHSTVNGERMGG